MLEKCQVTEVYKETTSVCFANVSLLIRQRDPLKYSNKLDFSAGNNYEAMTITFKH